MASTIVRISQLQVMASRGYDLSVLSAIEHAAIAQAVDMREARGLRAHPGDEVLALAGTLVPGGAQLDQLYMETLSHLREKPLQTLERIADQLGSAAAALEQTAARSAARPVTLAQFAKIQGAIGQRYAQLIQAAQTLERAGVVPVYLQGRLANLSQRPDGPLGIFYDKAVALIDTDRHSPREPMRQRQRAA
ncbi:MAG TPA: hypothetical protein VN259_04565 [Xanthomonadales bacterium]|nr:hypothetical protein [Xanthomonadales bacterium]